MTGFKYFTTVIAALVLIICSCDSREKEIFFPQLSEQKVVMLALLEGNLVLENGCLKVKAENAPELYTIVWPPYVELYTKSGKVEVREKGNVIAKLGEPIRMGGGIVDAPDIDVDIKHQCGKPFWIAGKISADTNK